LPKSGAYTRRVGRCAPFDVPQHSPFPLAHEWPAPLRKFVLGRGADAVEQAGEDALGFPGSWAQSPREYFQIVEWLTTDRANRKTGG
jgi:hypothetical protein